MQVHEASVFAARGGDGALALACRLDQVKLGDFVAHGLPILPFFVCG